MHFSSFQLHCMHKIYGIAQPEPLFILPSLFHSPGTRTCRDPGAAQTLSAASTCWSRACAVSRSVRRSYRAERPMIICASPDGVSKKFDSVAIDVKVQALRVNTKTETHTLTLTHTHSLTHMQAGIDGLRLRA